MARRPHIVAVPHCNKTAYRCESLTRLTFSLTPQQQQLHPSLFASAFSGWLDDSKKAGLVGHSNQPPESGETDRGVDDVPQKKSLLRQLVDVARDKKSRKLGSPTRTCVPATRSTPATLRPEGGNCRKGKGRRGWGKMLVSSSRPVDPGHFHPERPDRACPFCEKYLYVNGGALVRTLR